MHGDPRVTDILKVEGLTKRLGDFVVVNNLSFSVKRGEVLGFLGQNGAGKSTTIKMLANLVRPTSGDILLEGVSIFSGRTAKSRWKMGVIVEAPRFYPHLSGRRNLELLARLYGLGGQRVDELIQRVGLSERQHEKFGRYSMGMKQRLGLASVLLNNPTLIVLDEPTSGLDPVGMKQIRDLIKELVAENGVSVLICTHMLEEVAALCDRAIVIDRGQMILEQTLKSAKDMKSIERCFADIAARQTA